MVLEAFAAISLAGNILEFVDFGLKLLDWSKEIYQSPGGTSTLETNLHKNTTSIKRCIHEMELEIPESQEPGQSWEERELRSLAVGCKQTADKLLAILEKLRKIGGRSKWQSLYHAARMSMWKAEVEELRNILSEYRSQVGLCILTILKNKQSNISTKLDQLSKSCEKHGTDVFTELNSLREKVEKLSNQVSTGSLSDGDLDTISNKLAKELHSLSLKGEEIGKQQAVLATLWYRSLAYRHDQIPGAHRKTFQWIFATDTISFADWLKSGNNIYWIAGKAGSGKSTLMKFIADHEKTKELLQTWADNQMLITASFYFWNAGTDMQKSLRGLLQSLLYEILRKAPSLIPVILPSRVPDDARMLQYVVQHRLLDILLNAGRGEASSDAAQDLWSLSELQDAFHLLSIQSTLPAKICFFIDGLDEYEGHHPEAIQILKILAIFPGIKICISSRPWNVFQHAFGYDNTNKLLLEILTKKDIEFYIRTQLNEDDVFVQACASDPNYQSLVDDLVTKAEGVFLWVALAVRSLLNGLKNADTVAELRSRLGELPPDLKALYAHMLTTIEERYKSQANILFRLAFHAKSPLPLIAMQCIDEGGKDVLDLAVTSLQRSDIVSYLQTTWQRLNARCNGLLAVFSSGSEWAVGDALLKEEAPDLLQRLRVDFIHRSVKEFLKEQHFDNTQLAEDDQRSDVLHRICLGLLRSVKCLRCYSGLSADIMRAKLEPLIEELCNYAQESERVNEQPETIVVNQLGQILHQGEPMLFLEDRPPTLMDASAYAQFPTFDEDGSTLGMTKTSSVLWRSFPAYTMCTGLILYVEAKIKAGDEGYGQNNWLMDWLYIWILQSFQWRSRAAVFYDMASLVLARHGIGSLQHCSSDFRMFFFSGRRTDEKDEVLWGLNPREWPPERRPTLEQALIFFCRHTDSLSYYRCFLKELFDAGADPNKFVEGLLPWIEAVLVADIINGDFVSLFLHCGADPNLRCTFSMFGEYPSCPSKTRDDGPNTPWTIMLNASYNRWKRSPCVQNDPQSFLEQSGVVMEAFLKAGADVQKEFILNDSVSWPGTAIQSEGEPIKVGQILREVLDEETFARLQSEYHFYPGGRIDTSTTAADEEGKDEDDSEDEWSSVKEFAEDLDST